MDREKEQFMLKNEDMPAPETMVQYSDGEVGAAMFHYAAEGQRFDKIASEQGFESRFLLLQDCDEPELISAHENGASAICEIWHPEPPEGWQLAAKYDTEEGPVVMFIRRCQPIGKKALETTDA